jgi:nucleoside-diphosphate-sugar epimerase
MSAGSSALDETGRVYNIGSGKPIAVRTLVEAIAELVGECAIDRVDFGTIPYRPDDCADRYADITAARRDLAFEPEVPLIEGLCRTVHALRPESVR